MILFLFPFAGGSASYYYPWRGHLGSEIKAVCVELPGHGTKIRTEGYRTFNEMVEYCVELVIQHLRDDEFAFYGHSMGCQLAFFVARTLELRHNLVPSRLFLSGSCHPEVFKKTKRLGHLPEGEFREEIVRLGGITEAVADSPELMKLFLPVIRRDVQALDTLRLALADNHIGIGSSITFFYSSAESGFSELEARRWSELCKGEFEFHSFPGNHFFINDWYPKIVAEINKLTRITRARV